MTGKDIRLAPLNERALSLCVLSAVALVLPYLAAWTGPEREARR